MQVLGETFLNPPLQVSFIFTSADPRTEGGVRRGVGSVAMAGDGSLYKKTGDADTDWAPLLEATGQVAVLQKTVTLTDADIKTVSGSLTNLYEIVPAPGANKLALPLAGILIADFAGGLYTNIAATDAFLGVLVGAGTPAFLAGLVNSSNPQSSFTGLFAQADKVLVPLAALAAGVEPESQFTASDKINQPINLELYNGAGALTGGNAANTLKVTVLYAIVDV